MSSSLGWDRGQRGCLLGALRTCGQIHKGKVAFWGNAASGVLSPCSLDFLPKAACPLFPWGQRRCLEGEAEARDVLGRCQEGAESLWQWLRSVVLSSQQQPCGWSKGPHPKLLNLLLWRTKCAPLTLQEICPLGLFGLKKGREVLVKCSVCTGAAPPPPVAPGLSRKVAQLTGGHGGRGTRVSRAWWSLRSLQQLDKGRAA